MVEECAGFAEGALDLALEGYNSRGEGVFPDKQSEFCGEGVEDGEGVGHLEDLVADVIC